jgi:hypothetical protein
MCTPHRKSWGRNRKRRAWRKPGKGKKGKAVIQDGGEVQPPRFLGFRGFEDLKRCTISSGRSPTMMFRF